MSDFVAETGNISVCDWANAAQEAETALGELRESSLQGCLSTLEATLWTAETGAGAASAATEMAKLARQMRDQTQALTKQIAGVYK